MRISGSTLAALAEACLILRAGSATCAFDEGSGSSGHLQVVAGVIGRPGGVQGESKYSPPALLNAPKGIAVDEEAGLFYVADTANHVVRSAGISMDVVPGKPRTVAGTVGRSGASGDYGRATEARLFSPHSLSLDAAERKLYISDSENHAVRLVDLARGTIISAVGVLASPGASGDGESADKAQLRNPTGLALDLATRRLFVADSGNHAVRAVDLTTGAITTLVGVLGSAGTFDEGLAATAQLNTPLGLAFDPSGWLYVADSGNHVVRRVDVTSGRVTSLDCRCSLPVASVAGLLGRPAVPSMTSAVGRPAHYGSSSITARDQGPAADIQLRRPSGLALDAARGLLYVADSSRPVVLRVDLSPGGRATTAVSRPGYYDQRSQDGGPVGLAIAARAQILLLAEAFNHVVRRLDLSSSSGGQTNNACP